MTTIKQTTRPKYLVAIVGRPNVGKSTLFNKLIGRRQAILSDIPGTTRDILYGDIIWNRVNFTIADTAGIEIGKKASILDEDILAQTQTAIAAADLIIFLTDAREGLQNEDRKAAELIRKLNKPVILAVNKAEGTKYDNTVHEFHKLGLGTPILISAIRGRGTGDLLDNTVRELKKIKKPRTKKASVSDKNRIKVAILGRPNTGKSTLFNKLVGEKRALVSSQPGTTRDTVNAVIETKDLEIEIIDTAGLRKRGKIEKGIEKFSSLRVIKALQNADIALLLIEGPEGVIAQDMHIAQIILEERKGFILLINKWDAVEKTGTITAEYDKYLDQKFAFAKWMSRIYISGLTGQRTQNIADAIKETWESLNTRIPSKKLNNIIGDAYHANLPKGKRKAPKIYFASIRQVNPPTITLKTNHPEEIHFSYLRYLENKIRTEVPMIGSPLKWDVIKSSTKELI